MRRTEPRVSRIRTVVATEILLVFGLLAFVAAAYLVERLAGLGAVPLSPPAALLLSAVPALLWLAYFYAQDRHEPEPKHYVLGTYLLGAFVAGPLAAFAIAQVSGPTPLTSPALGPLEPERLVRAILIVGLAHELCKYLVVRYTVYLSPEFDEPMDGIIYMTAAGIGFANFQNFHYFQSLQGDVLLTAGARDAVVNTLAHACFAGVLGYALGRAKFSAASPALRSATLFAGLLCAAVLNGVFHLVSGGMKASGLELQPWRTVAFAAGFAAIVFFVTSLLMRRLLALSPFRPQANEPGDGA